MAYGDILDDWKLREIERKADRAVDKLWKLDALSSNVDSMERTLREASSCIDGLRSALETTLNRVERLELEIESIRATVDA